MGEGKEEWRVKRREQERRNTAWYMRCSHGLPEGSWWPHGSDQLRANVRSCCVLSLSFSTPSHPFSSSLLSLSSFPLFPSPLPSFFEDWRLCK